MTSGRLLHYVYKIPQRKESVEFFRSLGMKALRHEEFTEGCEAQCNGPYSGHWSKTMIGYGDEDTNFVLELTYNYGVRTYKPGNTHQASIIKSKRIFKQLSTTNQVNEKSRISMKSPCGYTFEISDADEDDSPHCGVRLSSTNLEKTTNFWTKLAKLSVTSKSKDEIKFQFDKQPQMSLEFIQINEKIEPAGNYGRIALSWPTDGLDAIEANVIALGGKVLTSKVVLPTPGKADVVVVIVADPDGHEVCFVGDDGFRDLSVTDSAADSLLDNAMKADLSDAWHTKQEARGIKH